MAMILSDMRTSQRWRVPKAEDPPKSVETNPENSLKTQKSAEVKKEQSESRNEVHTPPKEISPEEKFKQEEKIAQEVLKKLQDKQINKPRWAL